MNELTSTKESRALTVAEVRSNVNLIQEVMKSVMKKDVHYGVVPGCGMKPTLLKPGAEKIMATFKLSADPVIDDLSNSDCVKYRITVKLNTFAGVFVGSGIGECSSDEEKFKWRKAIGKEFDETPEDRRRSKWANGKEGPYQLSQVRTNPADLANTVLKMAKKRALVDAVLTATAASDIFNQDIEELPEELRQEEAAPVGKPAVEMPQEKKPDPKTSSASVISEPQAKRLYAISKGSGYSDEDVKAYLSKNYGIDSSKAIAREHYEDIVSYFQVKKNG